MNHGSRGWYPELDLFPDERAARDALARTPPYRWRMVKTIIFAIILGAAWGGLLSSHVRSLLRQTPVARYADVINACTISFVIGTLPLLELLIQRRRVRRALREQLVARGVPICLPCGYDLRGLSEPRCPECGAHFDAKLLEPRA